jgi:hypothetical protein
LHYNYTNNLADVQEKIIILQLDKCMRTLGPNYQCYDEIITRFFKYNNYKNHIINNKNDKRKNLNLRMTARHCQWRLYWNAPLPVTRLSSTNINRTNKYLRVYFIVIKNPADKYLRVYFIVIKNPFLGKRATDSGAFTQRRHW